VNLTSSVLPEELRIFEEHKVEWFRSNLEQFVVVVGSKVVGFYPDYESGFKSGLSVAGLGNPFLLKQVCAGEPVYLIY
jgi:hypothetical protein